MSTSDSAPQPGHHNPSGSASFGSRFANWLKKPTRLFDRRSRRRIAHPPLRAYLGVVGSAVPYPLGNISGAGFYMLTSEHWHPGTRLPLRLERTDRLGFAAISRMVVQACVMRQDSKGVGFLFVPVNQPSEQQEATDNPGGAWGGTRWADQQAINELMNDLETMQSGGSAAN